MPTSTVKRRRGRFAGLSPADRRAERRRLLLDAAFDLLATEGAAGTTVRAVCQAAELNPRYFYESFDDLDALLVAVYERLIDELRATLAAALDAAGDDLRSQVRTAVTWTVGFIDDDRRRARVLYIESVGSETMNRRRLAAGYELTQFIEQDARRRRRHGTDGTGDPVGTITAAVLVGGISEVLTSWIEGRIDVEREQLVEDLTELFVAVCDSAALVARHRRATAGS
jgi:AcrR family transcriptional regulator